MESQVVLHILRHVANRAGVLRHEGQLQVMESFAGQVMDREAVVHGVIGVVGKRHLLAQHNEDA